MKSNLIISLVLLSCLTACSSFSQQKRSIKKITVAAADSSIALPDKIQKQLSGIKQESAHLLFTGGDSKLTETGSRWLAAKKQTQIYKIDLSAITSKYIGETEKNLNKIFKAATENKAVLLFDEADALFGKRSDVKDANDKYSNAEVSYLLQRIEAYKGIVIINCNTDDCIKQAAQAGLVKIYLQ